MAGYRPTGVVTAFAASILLVTACGAIAGSAGLSAEMSGVTVPTSRDTGTYTFFLDELPGVVWFEMQQVFTASRLPIAEHEVGGDRAYLVSRRVVIPAGAVHCGARPSGEAPLAQQVQGVLRAELERVGATRTQITFRLDAQSDAVEPGHTRRRSACVSRGTLERRIVERTEERLRG